MPKNTSERIIDRPLSGRQTARVWSGSSSTNASGTTDSTTVNSILAAEFITLNADTLLTNERYLAVSDALTKTDGGAGAALTIGLATPGTLSATSADVATGAHTHAITASAAPGAAESLLKSTSAGLLTLPLYTATTKVTTPLIDTASGALSLRPSTPDVQAVGAFISTAGTTNAGGAIMQGVVDSGNSFAARAWFGHNAQWSTTGDIWSIDDVGANDASGLLLRNAAAAIDFIFHTSTGASSRTMDHSTFTAGAKFTMTSAGRLGVLNTSPSYELDVTGTGRITTSLTTPLITTGTNVDLVINPAGTGAVQFPNDQTLRTSTFDGWAIPYTTGFQINEFEPVPGGSSSVLTIGRIQADELDVRVFVANETRVSRGDEFWTKSFGVLAESFTTPSSIGGTVSVKFEDSPAITGAIFVNSDWVLIRKLEIGTGLSLYNVWGQVATYVNNGDGTQSWTFTLRGGPTDKLIDRGSLGIDFGQVGAALIHLSVVDASGSPYIKLRKWVSGSDPMTITGPNFKTYVQIGELGSISNSYYTPSGFGWYVQPSTSDARFIVADDNGLQIRGASFKMYDGAAQTVDISSTDGSMKLGTDVSSSATTAFDFDASTGDLSITGDLYTSDVYLTEASGILINVGDTESAVEKKSVTWHADIDSPSATPILGMYGAVLAGGDTYGMIKSYSGTDLSTLYLIADGASANNSQIFMRSQTGTQSIIELSSDEVSMVAALTRTGVLTVSGNLTVSGGNIAVSGTVDGVNIAAFKTAYDSHTHSGYLATTGGTLTGTLTAQNITFAADNTYDIGAADKRVQDLYAVNLHVNTIVGSPNYTHAHDAAHIITGTLDFARIPTTWNGALTLDADTGLTSNYVRWTTQTSTLKAWDLIGRAHDYATSAQQNDLLLTYTDNTTSYIVWQADSGTRVVDFLNTPTVSGTAVSLSGHTHDDRYYTEAEVTSLLTGYVPTSRTVSAGGGLTGGGALSGNVTISHDDTSTQTSVNNSGTTFIQDVTLDTYGHVTALGSIDVATALDSRYVNTDGDTMTGGLTLEYSNAIATINNTATTQYSKASIVLESDAQDADTHWHIFAEKASAGAATGATTFHIRKRNADGTVAATPFVVDASNNVILNNGYTAGGGTNGNVGIKKTPGAYALDVNGSMAASTSVLTPTVTTTSGNLSLTSVGGTVAVTGALTGSSTAAFTTSVSTPTVTTASGNLSLTSAGGTVAVTGALTGSSTGVFTSTLTAASDTDAINTFGRVRLGYAAATDTASFAHFDQNTSTNFALSQSASGATIINAISGQTLSLSNAGNATATVSASGIDLQSGKHIGSSDYASRTSGWRVDALGGADVRYLYADEMHVKSFIADLEMALAGAQVITKSVSVLAQDFVVPYAGGTQVLVVKDLPSAPNMAAFEANDIVALRSFSRSAGTFSAASAWGAVTSYSDGTGTQTWTFTRSGTTTYNAITQRGTATSNSTSSGTSTTVTKPTGVVSGDVMLAVVTHDGAADTITATGWTIIGTYTSGTDINFAMYYRVAGGSEGANYSFSTVSSHALAASIVAYYNVDSLIIDDYSISPNAASTSMTGTTVYGTATANMLVFLGGITNNSASTAPGGMTELIDAGSTGIRVYVAHQTLAASGETGSKVATISASHASIVGMVALRPTYSAMTTAAGAATPGTVISAESLVLDFGDTTNGYYEVTTLDGLYGVNSPYAQVATWSTHPAVDAVCRVRMGNLTGLSGATAGEYGLYAGDGTIGTAAQYLRVSTAGVQLNNVPIKLYNAGTQTVNIDSAGTDIWVGPNSSDKRLTWNGTTLGVTGAVTISAASGFSGSGYLQVGSGTKDSSLNGFNIDSSEIVGQASGVDQVVLGTDGKIKAGAGNVVLDSSGITAVGDGTFILKENSATVKGYIYSSNPLDSNILNSTGVGVKTNGTAATEGVSLLARATSSRYAEIGINASSSSTITAQVYNGTTTGRMRVGATSFDIALSGTGSNDFSVDSSSGVIVSPSVTTTHGITLTMPTSTSGIAMIGKYNTTDRLYLTISSSTSQFYWANDDFGNNVTGPAFLVGRNTNGTNSSAGSFGTTRKGGGAIDYMWADNSGVWRTNTSAPTGTGDTGGTIIGSQSSWVTLKTDITSWSDYEGALNAVTDLPLFSYKLISDETGRQYRGIVITDDDRGAWFSENDADGQVPALNERNLIGYLIASVKALRAQVEALQHAV